MGVSEPKKQVEPMDDTSPLFGLMLPACQVVELHGAYAGVVIVEDAHALVAAKDAALEAANNRADSLSAKLTAVEGIIAEVKRLLDSPNEYVIRGEAGLLARIREVIRK